MQVVINTICYIYGNDTLSYIIGHAWKKIGFEVLMALDKKSKSNQNSA